jgi:hypothetical protein
MTAASEYAGEVEARPITIELTKPMAPGFKVAAGALFSGTDVICPPSRGP